MTEQNSAPSSAPDEAKASRIARLFDIRLIVGGLLTVYGVILVITGLVEMHPTKSTDLHLNLWTGLGMVVVGVGMLVWMRLRPLEPPKPEELVEHGPRESRAS